MIKPDYSIGKQYCMAMDENIYNVLEAIFLELGKAEERHPFWPTDKVHAAAIVTEEAGELLQAANSYEETADKDYLNDMRKEAIQTACVSIRFLLNLEIE